MWTVATVPSPGHPELSQLFSLKRIRAHSRLSLDCAMEQLYKFSLQTCLRICFLCLEPILLIPLVPSSPFPEEVEKEEEVEPKEAEREVLVEREVFEEREVSEVFIESPAEGRAGVLFTRDSLSTPGLVGTARHSSWGEEVEGKRGKEKESKRK